MSVHYHVQNCFSVIKFYNTLLKIKVIHDAIEQGFSKSAFKGQNLNFHHCQRSRPEQLVIIKLVFNKHSVAYITCITNKHKFFEKINCPLHSKYINNKSKSGKTINLTVCNRGRPTRVFLWPMPIFRNQGS